MPDRALPACPVDEPEDAQLLRDLGAVDTIGCADTYLGGPPATIGRRYAGKLVVTV